MVKHWTEAERAALRDEVPKRALKTPFRSGTVCDIAREILAISESGLKNRKRLDEVCGDETHFLSGLKRSVEECLTPAERLLDLYHTSWKGDINRLFETQAY